VPIVETEALRGDGVDDLWKAICEHREFLGEDGLDARRRRNLEHELVAVAVAQMRRRLQQALERDPELQGLLDEVHARRLDPLSATREIADRVLGGGEAG
jgi:LAO/AO transport system kinase